MLPVKSLIVACIDVISVSLNEKFKIFSEFGKFRNNLKILYVCCFMLFVAIWIEKGFGLIVPGFIPGPYGKIVEYLPTGIEVGVTIGIWALGAFVFTILAKTAIGIELGQLRYNKEEKGSDS